MASRYFGINRGQRASDVVEGAATNSTDMEVVVDLSKNIRKQELLIALDLIKEKILKSTYPAE